ncbi:MAG: NADH-quinone oxidoreductase subunit NuoH [Thermoplasmatota archaeon]
MVSAPGNERNAFVNGLIWLQQWLAQQLHLPAPPDALAETIAFVIVALVIIGVCLGVGGIMSYVMRKLMARVQTRVGPNRVGPFGLLQFLADGFKLMTKEDFIPARADKWGFYLAPYLVILPIVVAFTPLPFGNGILLSDLSVGVLFILAISAVQPIGEIVAAWSSNNKYSMVGGLRAAALDVSYEIPMVLAAISLFLVAGTMNTMDLVQQQRAGMWFVLLQPIGALIFFAAALAKAGIVPMDLPEAESELVAGYFTEYAGMRFGVFFIGVFVNIIFISALTVVLFFGGWTIPGMPTYVPEWTGLLWFVIKVAFFVLTVLLVWFTLPRVRIDQFLNLGWKVLFPLSILNLLVAVGEVWVLKGGF